MDAYATRNIDIENVVNNQQFIKNLEFQDKVNDDFVGDGTADDSEDEQHNRYFHQHHDEDDDMLIRPSNESRIRRKDHTTTTLNNTRNHHESKHNYNVQSSQ